MLRNAFFIHWVVIRTRIDVADQTESNALRLLRSAPPYSEYRSQAEDINHISGCDGSANDSLEPSMCVCMYVRCDAR